MPELGLLRFPLLLFLLFTLHASLSRAAPIQVVNLVQDGSFESLQVRRISFPLPADDAGLVICFIIRELGCRARLSALPAFS